MRDYMHDCSLDEDAGGKLLGHMRRVELCETKRGLAQLAVLLL